MYQILIVAILSIRWFQALDNQKEFITRRKILVSIGIPTFNRPNQLISCLKNLLNQTYENLEIIVVDNDSDQNIIKNLYSSGIFLDKRIILLKNKKKYWYIKECRISFEIC